jgi:hypothetical protein
MSPSIPSKEPAVTRDRRRIRGSGPTPALSLDAQLPEADLDRGDGPPLDAGVGRIAIGDLDDDGELDFRSPVLLRAQVDRRVERKRNVAPGTAART